MQTQKWLTAILLAIILTAQVVQAFGQGNSPCWESFIYWLGAGDFTAYAVMHGQEIAIPLGQVRDADQVAAIAFEATPKDIANIASWLEIETKGLDTAQILERIKRVVSHVEKTKTGWRFLVNQGQFPCSPPPPTHPLGVENPLVQFAEWIASEWLEIVALLVGVAILLRRVAITA